MAYTLGQAARVVGRSKTTLGRAIKSGKISASRNHDGGYDIDPAELARAYPLTGNGAAIMERDATPTVPDVEVVQLRGERDRYRDLAEEREETIRHLRGLLDAEAEERRRVQAQLTGLLTGKVSDGANAPPWPRRVLRWLKKQHV